MNNLDSIVSSKFTMILAIRHLLHFQSKTKLIPKSSHSWQMKAKATLGLAKINYKGTFASMLFHETLREALLDCFAHIENIRTSNAPND